MNESRDLSLIMTFKNEDGNDSVLTIKQVRDDLEKEDLEEVMDIIISTGIFSSTGGDLVSKVKAQIVDKVTEEYKFA